MKVLLGILVVVLVLMMPVGQTQANANQSINGEVAVANVALLTSTPQIQTTQMVANDVEVMSDAAQITVTISLTPAVDEAEQANTAEAWNHQMASGVDRGEAPMINEAGIFTASFNNAIETANQNNDNRGTQNGSVIKTCTPTQPATLNTTNEAENTMWTTTGNERGQAPMANTTTNAGPQKANENTTTIADVPTVLRA